MKTSYLKPGELTRLKNLTQSLSVEDLKWIKARMRDLSNQLKESEEVWQMKEHVDQERAARNVRHTGTLNSKR